MATIGQLLLDRYHIERELARGGMAEVFLARDQRLDRPVAVKLLYAHLAGDPMFVERFRHEAKTAAGLAHPNVVEVYDFGDDQGRPLIVMEYVPGDSLADLLAREGALPIDEALAIVKPVLAALAHMHAKGLVHRDVKPANVLLPPERPVKLADFGIAQALADATVTHTGQVWGSVHFVAPERLTGARATPASDCYGVGIMLYRMLTGELPFEGDAQAAVVAQQLHSEPMPISQLRGDVPEWLEEVVARALVKDPARRYDSAATMLAAIEADELGHTVATAAVPVAGAARPRRAETVALEPGGAASAAGQPVRRTRPSYGAARVPAVPQSTPARRGLPRSEPVPRSVPLFWTGAILTGALLGALALGALYASGFLGGSGGNRVTVPNEIQTPAPSQPAAAVTTSSPTPQAVAAPAPTKPAAPTPTAVPPSPTVAPATVTPSPTATPSPSATVTVTPTRAPPTPRPEPASLRQRIIELRALLQAASFGGRATRDIEQIDRRLEMLERKLSDGKAKDARDDLRDIAQRVRDLASRNQIDRGVADQIVTRLDSLARDLPADD
ncbi:MAG: protein kinase [Chloroflexi bacterium]|nr:protein kinase [Chloroflexota bacterium]